MRKHLWCQALRMISRAKRRNEEDMVNASRFIYLSQGTNRDGNVNAKISAPWSWFNAALMKLHLHQPYIHTVNVNTQSHTCMATDIGTCTHWIFRSLKCTCSHFGERQSYGDTILLRSTGLEECHVLWWDVSHTDCQYHLHILKFRPDSYWWVTFRGTQQTKIWNQSCHV